MPQTDSPPESAAARRLGPKLALCTAALALLFLLLEGGVRLYLARFADSESFQLYASGADLVERLGSATSMYRLHPNLGYTLTPGFRTQRPGTDQVLNRHNSLGFRGDEIERPKPPGRYRIVCLGGSTTYSTTVFDYRLSYPYLLGEELSARSSRDVDVVNAGVGGWGSLESLINFQLRLLDLEPDLIIVYHAVNDLSLRFTLPEIYAAGQWNPTIANHKVFIPQAIESCALCRTLGVRTGVWRPHSERMRIGPMGGATRLLIEFRRQWSSGAFPEGIFTRLSPESILAQNPPIYFQQNLENLVVLARSRGIEVILATFAYSPRFSNYWAGSEVFQQGYAEMQATVESIANRKDVNLFDFAAVFPQDVEYFFDGVHVTERGAQLKARLFADYVLENGFLEARRADR